MKIWMIVRFMFLFSVVAIFAYFYFPENLEEQREVSSSLRTHPDVEQVNMEVFGFFPDVMTDRQANVLFRVYNTTDYWIRVLPANLEVFSEGYWRTVPATRM